jgi:predicted GNAT family acetyltransferase
MRTSEEKATKLSRKELARACAESFTDCWTLAYASSPKKVLWQEPDMTLFSTGGKSDLQNGVLKARFTTSNMTIRTKRALEYFKTRQLPMAWYVDPWSTPARLGLFLRKLGLTPKEKIPCMAMYLNRVKRKPLPAGLSIRPVTDLKSHRTCVTTAYRGFGRRKTENDQWREIYMGLGFGPTKRWFTGFLDGKPVASSLLLLQGGLATVWIVATRKEARGRGIGTAMTREALLLAKELDYDYAVIQSSSMGLPVYKNMGFVEYSKIKTYFWKPD